METIQNAKNADMWKERVKDWNLCVAQIGSTLYIFSESERAKVCANIVPNGPAMVEGQLSEWITDEVVFHPGKEGSDQYTWDKSGNKVKHIRYHHRRLGQVGTVVKTKMCVVYKSL